MRAALGVDALDVVLSREEASIALPLVRHDLTTAARAAQLRQPASAARPPEEWISDLVDDPHGVWRSPWLVACAAHAAERQAAERS